MYIYVCVYTYINIYTYTYIYIYLYIYIPANASSVLACACEAGYANGSAACAPCALGRYKGELGNATCAACPASTNMTAVARVGWRSVCARRASFMGLFQ